MALSYLTFHISVFLLTQIFFSTIHPIVGLKFDDEGFFASSPKWTGTFKIDGSCEQAECCCLAGETTISQPNDTELLVTGSVAGTPCHAQLNGSTTVSVSLPIPQEKDGFQLTTVFLGSHSRFTLSENSQYIVDVNFDAPKCSDSAYRTDGGKGTGALVSPTSFVLLFNALLFYIFF